MTRHFVMYGMSHALGLGLVVCSLPMVYALCRRYHRYRVPIGGLIVLLLLGFECFSPYEDFVLLHSVWQRSLPLNMCDFSRVCLAGYILGGPNLLAALGLFWGVGGGGVAFLSPDIHADFPSFEYCSFFFSHSIIFYAIAYIFAVSDYRPQRRCLWRAIAVGVVVSWFVYVIDIIIGSPANYWYLMQIPKSAVAFRKVLPAPPWNVLSYYLVAIITFGLVYLPFSLLRKKQSHDDLHPTV